MTAAPGCNGTTYTIAKDGNGPAITKGCTATVHALGEIVDSGGAVVKKFWSTKDPGQKSFTYQAGVGELIKGWDQGCLGMKVGETRVIVIPGHEGYGPGGFPAWGIPPNATLKFTLECLNVK